jgi:hypothetical protein
VLALWAEQDVIVADEFRLLAMWAAGGERAGDLDQFRQAMSRVAVFTGCRHCRSRT